jgi:hypothetical protein
MVGGNPNQPGGDFLSLFMVYGDHNTFSNISVNNITDADIYRMWGHDHLITRNVVTNCTNPGYSTKGVHADLIQFWGCDDSYNNVFENSTVSHNTMSSGMMSSDSPFTHTACSNMNDWTYRNNIFWNTSTLMTAADRMHIYGNVFDDSSINFFATFYGNQMFENNVVVSTAILDSYGKPNAFVAKTNAWDNASHTASTWDMVDLINPNALTITDPGFVNASAGDFHLLSTSPLRGAGTNLSGDAFASTVDHDGRPRPATGAWDIGPYQYTGP